MTFKITSGFLEGEGINEGDQLDAEVARSRAIPVQ
jgi:hypothetical protein